MAFIDFSDAGMYAPPMLQFRAAHAVELSVLERRVIELAREDRLETLRPARRRSWLARLVFGPQPPSPSLANPRLEALRRLAVMAWHQGYRLPASALRDAQDAGYSEAQAGAVVDLVAELRTPVRRRAA